MQSEENSHSAVLPGNPITNPPISEEPATNAPCLVSIPGELFLQIASYLSVSDVLVLRETCTRLHSLTYGRSLWQSLFHSMRDLIPLPAYISRDPAAVIASLPDAELEDLVTSSNRIHRAWLRPRAIPLVVSPQPKATIDAEFDKQEDGAKTVLTIDVFLERWLVCVYHERLVELWDLLPQDASGTCERPWKHEMQNPVLRVSKYFVSGGLFTSACFCLDEERTTIFMAITSDIGCTFCDIIIPGPDWAREETQVHVETIVTLRLPGTALLVRTLYPPANLAFFSYSNSYALVNWKTGRRWTVEIHRGDDEELWNGVVAARFVTARHILCVKARAVELCTLAQPTDDNPLSAKESTEVDMQIHADVTTSSFMGTTFRGASFSAIRHPSPGPLPLADTDSRASVSFLAYDVLRGLFHYRVSLLLPSSHPSNSVAMPLDTPPPHISVLLLAAHHMAIPFTPAAGTGSGQEASTRVPRSGLTPGSRGFVTSCVLGPDGKRGVWVERRRGSMKRAVVGFSVSADAWDDVDDKNVDPGQLSLDVQRAEESDLEEGAPDGNPEQNWWEHSGMRAIDGKTLYEVNSYDLRADDITHCAFSEATGKVVLATRHGELQLL